MSIDAQCPGCGHLHAVAMGVVQVASYGVKPWPWLAPVKLRKSGYLMRCSRCGTDFVVAGGSVYRWLVGRAGGDLHRDPAPSLAERPLDISKLEASISGRWKL